MKNYPYYGLDFGTSNTAIAVNIDGTPRIIPLALDGGYTIPSVLYFFSEGRIFKFGDEAVAEYITRGMKGRFMQSLKSFLPEESFSGTYINGFGQKSLEDLIAMILYGVKSRADKFLGKIINNVVIGIPAKFVNELDYNTRKVAEERLHIAALKAGFKEVSFYLEPIAAAYYYELSLSEPQLVLIGDFGGGTSDFTIINLRPRSTDQIFSFHDRTHDILATGGIPIAGNSFTSDIMKQKLLQYFGEGSHYKSWDKILDIPVHLLHLICKWENLAFMKGRDYRSTINMLLHNSDNPDSIRRMKSLIENNLGYSLFQSIEAAKIQLSQQLESYIDYSNQQIDIHEKITRDEYNSIIEYVLQKIDNVINEMLVNANRKVGDIQAIFLTGGSSATPLIKNYFVKKFGEGKIKSGDNFTSVAQGLAS